MYVCMYIYIYTHISLSLSLHIYIYIYIYIHIQAFGRLLDARAGKAGHIEVDGLSAGIISPPFIVPAIITNNYFGQTK